MKKLNTLLATALFLGSAHSTYAQITPEMSPSELKALLESLGAAVEPADTGEVPENPAVDLAQEVAQPLPPYVTVDDSGNPAYQIGACTLPDSTTFTVTGESMGTYMSFPVTVTGTSDGTDFSQTVNWKALPPDPPNVGLEAGAAIGTGWFLYEAGDTWDQIWRLTTDPGVVVESIKIELWRKHGDKSAVFDIINGITTPPSKGGFPFTKRYPVGNWPSDTTAVYSLPILPHPPVVPPVIPQDLYGTLTINFPSGFSGTGSVDGLLNFRADTDCMVPFRNAVEEVQATRNANGFKVKLLGEGLVVAQESCAGKVAQSIIDVPKEGLVFEVQDTALKADCDYSFVDENLNLIPLEVDNQKMSNHKYRHR